MYLSLFINTPKRERADITPVISICDGHGKMLSALMFCFPHSNPVERVEAMKFVGSGCVSILRRV